MKLPATMLRFLSLIPAGRAPGERSLLAGVEANLLLKGVSFGSHPFSCLGSYRLQSRGGIGCDRHRSAAQNGVLLK